MAVFDSRISPASKDFRDDRADLLELVADLRELEARAPQRSARSAARFEERGQLLPRERLALLLDPGAPFLELQALAGYAMADDGSDAAREDSTPGGNQITGVGFVSGTRCVIVVTDSGINAGAYNTAGIAKVMRAQKIALHNRLPFVHLVESAGANISSYRVDGFVNGGEMFANLARLSAAGLPVITALHGSSTAGGAYMPGLSDVVVAVKDRGRAFLAGPPLLESATGEIATADELGGATMHAEVSGLAEHLAADDADAIRIVREVVDRLHWGQGRLTALPADFAEPTLDADQIAGIVPSDYRRPYDVREIIARIADGSELLEFKALYGSSSVCVEAEVFGLPVAFIGNNGPIDNAGATKIAHFIHHCTQIGTPLTFLQNTTGYMVGREHERGGIIKHGSKMIQAVTTTTVPKFTFMIGASFGAGNFGMCGRGYDPDFLFSWPNSRIGLMGPEQAGKTMRTVAEEGAKRKGREIDTAILDQQEAEISELIESQSDAFYSSGRLLDDAVIDPRDTRRVLGFVLQMTREAEQLRPHPLSFGVARL